MMDIAEFTFGLLTNVLSSIIYDISKIEALPFLQKRKIIQKVEDATANVIEPLIPFLNNEKIDNDKQQLLIETCISELKPIIDNPSRIFQSSMNGEKLFEEQYRSQPLPQEIIELELADIYSLLFPRIATIICKIPEAIQYWENEAWSETFTRLDEITLQLQKLFALVNELDSHKAQSDEFLTMLRKSRAQKIGLDLDVTGLRADTIVKGKFDDFFVHPAIQFAQQNRESLVISNTDESCNQFIRPYQKTILIGAPGAGKSTWSKWIERQALTHAWAGIPIRIELRGIKNKKDMPITDVFNTIIGNTWSDEMTIEKIRNWSKSNQILLIFDGFDEVRPSERDECLEWINDITLITKDCPIILTSRPITTNHLETLGDSWETWTILPFDNPRIIEYVTKWYTHIPLIDEANRAINAEDLVADWSGDPTLEPLTGNPLLLSTLLMVHQLDGRLPTGRAQLYRRYIEGMIGIWDDRRQISNGHTDLDLNQKHQIMRKIALTMLLQEVDELDETNMLDIVASYLNQWQLSLEPADVIYSLRERTGLIVGPGSYSFTHKSIAEYLVAELIFQGNEYSNTGIRIDRFYLFQQRNNDRWNTVTFLWAGITSLIDLENFITECIVAQVYDLGYGLLYDQFERLSPDFCTRKVHFLVNNAIELPPSHISRVLGNGYPGHIQYETFSIYPLRAIGYGSPITELIESSINKGYLNINNYKPVSIKNNKIFYLTFLDMVNDIDEINFLLEYGEKFINNSYINFIKTSVITDKLIEEQITPNNIIKRDFFYIHIVDDINLYSYLYLRPKNNLINNLDNISFHNHIFKLHKAYKNIEKFSINEDILLSTYHWKNPMRLDQEFGDLLGFDLLLDTFTKLEQIKNLCNEATYSIIDKLIIIVNDLRILRDNLTGEQRK